MIDLKTLVRMKHGGVPHDLAEAAVRKLKGGESTGPNLLHVTADNIVTGKYINNSGAETSSSKWFYCEEYVPVTDGQPYIIGSSQSLVTMRVSEYGPGQDFVKTTTFTAPNKKFQFTPGSGTSFLRISANISDERATTDLVLSVEWRISPGWGSDTYVTAEPENWVVAASAYVNIYATAHNTVGTVSYQWYKRVLGETEYSKTTLGGNTTDTLNFQQNTARSGYSYACEVTDDNGKHMSNWIHVKRPE